MQDDIELAEAHFFEQLEAYGVEPSDRRDIQLTLEEIKGIINEGDHNIFLRVKDHLETVDLIPPLVGMDESTQAALISKWERLSDLLENATLIRGVMLNLVAALNPEDKTDFEHHLSTAKRYADWSKTTVVAIAGEKLIEDVLVRA